MEKKRKEEALQLGREWPHLLWPQTWFVLANTKEAIGHFVLSQMMHKFMSISLKQLKHWHCKNVFPSRAKEQ